jgi:hypothetical protein
MGWDLPVRKATIFDGGEVIFEVINIDQVGNIGRPSGRKTFLPETDS